MNKQTGFAGHTGNLKRLREACVLLFGARYGDKGVVVLTVQDEAATRTALKPVPALARSAPVYSMPRSTSSDRSIPAKCHIRAIPRSETLTLSMDQDD